jgi:hypothetical protein
MEYKNPQVPKLDPVTARGVTNILNESAVLTRSFIFYGILKSIT